MFSHPTFLANYRGHVISEWTTYYFAYDTFKAKYKRLKNASYLDAAAMDDLLLEEIKRVHIFILGMIDAIQYDLSSIAEIIDDVPVVSAKNTDHDIELSLRILYHKIRQCEDFFKLNHFAISKICKKFEKLPFRPVETITTTKVDPFQPTSRPNSDCESPQPGSRRTITTTKVEPFQPSSRPNSDCESPQPGSRRNSDCWAETFQSRSRRNSDCWAEPFQTRSRRNSDCWDDEYEVRVRERRSSRCQLLLNFTSGEYFFYQFFSAGTLIDNAKEKCVDLYMTKFRRTYSPLAYYELEYIKNNDNNYTGTRFLTALKLGLIICMPSLYVYSTVGNLLLYRLGWVAQVFFWSKYDVNYISILRMDSIRPNLVMVMDQVCSLLVIYFVNLLLFLRIEDANVARICPIVLVILLALYQVYEFLFMTHSIRHSTGAFTMRVIRNCFSAPFIPCSFRDAFAADILTSFTHVLSDAVYASCWLFSGCFLSSYCRFTSDSMTSYDSRCATSCEFCVSNSVTLLAGLVQVIPLTMRALQCLRSSADVGWQMYPHGYNFVKYLLSLVVVVVSTVSSSNRVLTLYVLVALTAFYKWFWDVVMDWGLCEIRPHSFQDFFRWGEYAKSKLLLRQSIIYPYPIVYYAAIAMDLALRFIWVISLLPTDQMGLFVGYRLNFFLGSLEILRRTLWGCFRVEWEHLKLLKQGQPGFLCTPAVLGSPQFEQYAHVVNSYSRRSSDEMGF
eukprot:gene3872-4230_t